MTTRDRHPSASHPWRAIREGAGLTQERLAARAQISSVTLRKFESTPERLGVLQRSRMELLYRELERETHARLGTTTTTTTGSNAP